MTREVDFDPQEYEAAFLLNHFLCSCKAIKHDISCSSHSTLTTSRSYSITTETWESKDSGSDNQKKNKILVYRHSDENVLRPQDSNSNNFESVRNSDFQNHEKIETDKKNRCQNCNKNLKKLEKERKLFQSLLCSKIKEIKKLKKRLKKLKAKRKDEMQSHKIERKILDTKIFEIEAKYAKTRNEKVCNQIPEKVLKVCDFDQNLNRICDDNRLHTDFEENLINSSSSIKISKDNLTFYSKNSKNSGELKNLSFENNFPLPADENRNRIINQQKLNHSSHEEIDIKNQNDKFQDLIENRTVKNLSIDNLNLKKIFIQNENFLNTNDGFENKNSSIVSTPFLTMKMSKEESMNDPDSHNQSEDIGYQSQDEAERCPKLPININYKHNNYRNSYIIDPNRYKNTSDELSEDNCSSNPSMNKIKGIKTFKNESEDIGDDRDSKSYTESISKNDSAFSFSKFSFNKNLPMEEHKDSKGEEKNDELKENIVKDSNQTNDMVFRGISNILERNARGSDDLVCEIKDNVKFIEINPIDSVETEEPDMVESHGFCRIKSFRDIMSGQTLEEMVIDHHRCRTRNYEYDDARGFSSPPGRNEDIKTKHARICDQYDFRHRYPEDYSDSFSIEGHEKVSKPDIKQVFDKIAPGKILSGYICDYCQKKFSEKTELRDHLLFNHAEK